MDLIAWLQRPRSHLDRPAGPPNPFEAFLLGVCVVQGIAAVTGYSQPAAFETSFPGWVRHLWGALLLLGGIAAVIGLFWPWDPVDGVLIKRVGLIALAGTTIAYGLAGLASPHRLFIGATFSVAFGVACLVRARQVSDSITGLHRQLRGLREEWENGSDP